MGVYINSNLTWSTHIDKVYKRCLGLLFVLWSMKNACAKSDLVLVYNNCLRSILEFTSSAFVGLPKVHLKKLNLVQCRAHNIICFYNCHCSLLPKLSKRRLNQALKLFHQINNNNRHLLHDCCPDVLQHSRQFRNSYLQFSRSHYQFFPFISNYLNSTGYRN